jgi:hypothetical protein
VKKERRKRKEQAQQAKEQSKKMQSGNVLEEPISDAEMMTDIVGEDNFDAQLERILKILGVSSEDDAEVNWENLNTYFDYLEENIKLPFKLTGIEDMGCFGWEEYYTFGPGSKREHEKLKKQYPSYTDKYELLGFSDEIIEDEGIYVHVKRISDRKKFTLPLADLEATEKRSRNGQLLDDYVVWFVNYR